MFLFCSIMDTDLEFERKPVEAGTLRELVKVRRVLFFECGRCMHLTKPSLLDLVHAVGPDTPIGSFQKRLVCNKCGQRRAILLTCAMAGRRSARWLPREPRAFRT